MNTTVCYLPSPTSVYHTSIGPHYLHHHLSLICPSTVTATVYTQWTPMKPCGTFGVALDGLEGWHRGVWGGLILAYDT